MELVVVSFLAGLLTVAAPCVLPLLPIVLASTTLEQTTPKSTRANTQLFIVISSLMVSVFLFSLLLKSSTILIGVPTHVWQILSGSILVLYGLFMTLPNLWEQFASKLNLQSKAARFTFKKSGDTGKSVRSALLGVSLGPVFNSCSPTYIFIVAIILPTSFGQGVSYLLAYCLGLGVALLLVALLGKTLISTIGWAANPFGIFRRSIGVIVLLTGIVVALGLAGDLQSNILDAGLYEPIENIDMWLRNKL
jgi:cytochrome c-type biogenesis protein